jgi:TRAP-type C4-dicarboxylate transport system permease small subunit
MAADMETPPSLPSPACGGGLGWGVDTAEAFTRAVNRLFAITASILVVAIVVVVVREVVLRYGFNAPSTWGMDVARYLLLFTFFLAVAPALESGHHVHVDLFDPLVPPAWRRWLHLCGYVLVVAFGAVLFWYVLEITIDVFETDEFSFSVISIRLKYIYWIGPVGTLQFLLTGCVLLLRFWSTAPVPAHAER